MPSRVSWMVWVPSETSVPVRSEFVIEGEEVLGGDFFGFDFFAVEGDVDGHVRCGLSAGADVIGESFDAVGGVAGGVPIGGVAAIVDEIFRQSTGELPFGIGAGEQFEVIGVGFELAVVPVPPAGLGHLEIGGLIFMILHHILPAVIENHFEFVGVFQF